MSSSGSSRPASGPWDASMRRGGWTGSLPYIPGGEFAGVVEGGTGEDAGLDEGAPVYGYPGLSGCYAQYVRCPVEQLAPIPDGLPVTDAAGAPIDALTAHQGLTDVLSLGRGDDVLITAGAGGLGHLAVQIARILGARIVATASPQHHEFVHHAGAAVVIDHTKPDWPDQVRDVMDGGAQRVLACAAPTLEGAARAARDGATIATPVHAGLPETRRCQLAGVRRPAERQPPDPDGPVVRRRPAVGAGRGQVLLRGRGQRAPPGRRRPHPGQAGPGRGRRPGPGMGSLTARPVLTGPVTRRNASAGNGSVLGRSSPSFSSRSISSRSSRYCSDSVMSVGTGSSVAGGTSSGS